MMSCVNPSQFSWDVLELNGYIAYEAINSSFFLLSVPWMMLSSWQGYVASG